MDLDVKLMFPSSPFKLYISIDGDRCMESVRLNGANEFASLHHVAPTANNIVVVKQMKTLSSSSDMQ